VSAPRQRVEAQSVETALQRQQRELDLDQFVDVLVKGGIAAWRDGELQPRERARFLRQSDILSAAVAELKTLLDDADSEVRLDRLITLHEALGAVALIARQRLEDPAVDRALEKLLDSVRQESTTRAWKGRSSKRQQRETLTLAVGLQIRLRHPDQPARWVAGKTHGKLNKLLRARGELQVKQSTVYSYLRKNWARIAPPPKA
jgi:hypothetical protein